MKNPSDAPDSGQALREKLIGLGETSHRKSYYPELQRRLEELERFQTFLDHSNDAIFLIQVPSARIVDLNASACRQLGWGREELLQRSLLQLSDLGGNPEALQLIAGGDEDRRELALVETLLHRRDGGLIPTEMTLNRRFFQESAYVIAVARDIAKRKQAETERQRALEALWESEKWRVKLEAELEVAAEIQKKLLPQRPPLVAGFEIAASCRPAQHVGGDFYDWQEMAPGLLTLTLGDVMGKGLAAAMVMATVRAALRAVSQANAPARALGLAEQALHQDLSSSDSFVTLFHARLDAPARLLTYVDCGHGFVFLRRADGRVLELQPRGLPFGILIKGEYHEGSLRFEAGDSLVLYSDGLIDALPERAFDNAALAEQLAGATGASEMVARLTALVPQGAQRPDDLTVLVAFCTKNP